MTNKISSGRSDIPTTTSEPGSFFCPEESMETTTPLSFVLEDMACCSLFTLDTVLVIVIVFVVEGCCVAFVIVVVVVVVGIVFFAVVFGFEVVVVVVVAVVPFEELNPTPPPTPPLLLIALLPAPPALPADPDRLLVFVMIDYDVVMIDD